MRPKDGPGLIDVAIIVASPALVGLHLVIVGLGVLVLGVIGVLRGQDV